MTTKHIPNTLVFARLLASLTALLCACLPPTIQLDPTSKLRELQVTCETAQLPKNVYFPCQAIGVYSDGTTDNLSFNVTWQTDDPTVIETILVPAPAMRGLIAGSTDVVASLGNVQGRYSVTITNANPVALAVAPQDKVMSLGRDQQYASICVFSDSTFFDVTRSATWTSLDTSVADVTTGFTNGGLVTTRGLGSTSIVADFNGIQGNADVTVLQKDLLGIQVNPISPTVIQGLFQNFTAIGIYTDLTTIDLTDEVTWSVTDGSIVSISNAAGSEGRLLALQTGTTDVMAIYGGMSDSTDVTVTNPTLLSIDILSANPSLPKGFSQQLTALGHYSDGSDQDITDEATWVSVDPSIMSVSDILGTKGRITANTIGSTDISATFNGITAQTTGTVVPAVLAVITLAPANPVLPKGTSQALTATGIYSDGTTQDMTATATWFSTDATKVSVSDAAGTKGQLNAVNLGSATISATVGAITGQTLATVTAPSLISIAVTPINQSIAKGQFIQYAALGTYSDGSTSDISSSVTWGSDNAAVTISNAAGTRGRAFGAAIGSANISATLGLVSNQTMLTVTAPILVSIAVTPVGATVSILSPVQFTATGTYSDGTTANLTATVTWASSNTGCANISNAPASKGRASGAGIGTTIISATAPGGIVGSTSLSGPI